MQLGDVINLIKKDRPLIISDVDEVILNLLDPLESYLAERDHIIDLTQERFGGTIRHIKTGVILSRKQVDTLVDDFFEVVVDDQPFIEDALTSIAHLQQHAEVVALTNLPHQFGERRRKALSKLGLNIPLLTNEGVKGPTIEALSQATNAQVYFIDDTATHHASVAKHAPHVYRIHFIGHPTLAAHVPAAEQAHVRLKTWPEISQHIEKHIRDARPESKIA